MLLDVTHEIDLIDDELVVVLLHIVVVSQDCWWDSELQTNVRQAVVDKVAELNVDPRRVGDGGAESVAKVVEKHTSEVVIEVLLVFVEVVIVGKLLVELVSFHLR